MPSESKAGTVVDSAVYLLSVLGDRVRCSVCVSRGGLRIGPAGAKTKRASSSNCPPAYVFVGRAQQHARVA